MPLLTLTLNASKSDFQAMPSKSLSLSPSFAMFFVNHIPIEAGFEGSNLRNKKMLQSIKQTQKL